jgi:acetyl esterase
MPVDPCFATLLADKRSELRAPPAHVSISEMRDGNKAYLVTAPRTPVHAVESQVIDGPAGPLALRLYRPAPTANLPVVVFCHGGGFVLGDLDTHDAMCQRIAHSSGCVVASVDYRRAPETRFPGPLEDCYSALRHIAENSASLRVDGDRLALCGDSAGGNLAAAAALRARAEGPALRHLAVLYPMIDPACDSASMHEFARGHLLARSAAQWAWQSYLSNPSDAVEPLAALLRADLAGLPTTTVAIAEFDPLRDEGLAFIARLEAAGVRVTARFYAGMVHGFAGLPHVTPTANVALDEMAGDLRAALLNDR